ncbi:uncharacterized protein LOC135350143 [Halichondria panicea]|uniref:uncharacterized protein LOC135350143 n=1 Tax=Halichondria panicea TaxID=6063 RepID=UPI00312B7504
MHDEQTNSYVKIFANIIIAFIGAGILGLPYAFKEGGLVEGAVIMALIGAISIKAMLLLVDCKDRILLSSSYSLLRSRSNGNKKSEITLPSPGGSTPAIEYGDVGYAAFGAVGKAFVDILIVISQIGFCCAYLIFISENLYSIFPMFPQLGILFSLLLPLALLSNLRSLNRLAPFSLFADFANIFAYGIVFYFDMEHFHLIHIHIRNYSLEGLPFFLGIAIYCYEGAGIILSLEGSVAKEMRGNFRWIFTLSLALVTILYITFGVCGYLSFGQETESIITLNLPGGAFPFIVKGCLCFSLFFTYPIMMYPVALILERMFCINKDAVDSNSAYWKGSVLRTGLVVVSGLIVILVPDFSTLMALVGSGACTLLAFIFPGMFHWVIFKEDISKAGLAFDVFLILLGIIGSIIGIRDALTRLYDDSTSTHKVQDVLTTMDYLNSTMANTISSTLSSTVGGT